MISKDRILEIKEKWREHGFMRSIGATEIDQLLDGYLLHITQSSQISRLKEVVEYYAAKSSWDDLYSGAQLPLNLRKQSVIKKDDIDHVQETPGYSNECGGKRARQALKELENL